MSEASQTLEQPTLPGLLNATSSQESVVGVSPCISPDGQATDPCGQEAARVSRSRLPANGKAKQTSAICGQPFESLFAHTSLQSSLANRLHQRMAAYGSPEYSLTWKEWPINGQEPICALRASGRRTSDSGSTGWPSPQAHDRTRPGAGTMERGGRNSDLNTTAQTAGWASPRSTDAKCGHSYTENTTGKDLAKDATTAGLATPRANDAEKRGNVADCPRNGLVTQANMSGWNTPQATDGSNGGPNQANEALSADAATVSAWPTPTTRDHKDGTAKSCEKVKDSALLGRVCHTASGATQSGGNAQTESKGASRVLNPYFSAWLMGFPKEWTACYLKMLSRLPKVSKGGRRSSKATETQSTSNSPPNSSKL